VDRVAERFSIGPAVHTDPAWIGASGGVDRSWYRERPSAPSRQDHPLWRARMTTCRDARRPTCRSDAVSLLAIARNLPRRHREVPRLRTRPDPGTYPLV